MRTEDIGSRWIEWTPAANLMIICLWFVLFPFIFPLLIMYTLLCLQTCSPSFFILVTTGTLSSSVIPFSSCVFNFLSTGSSHQCTECSSNSQLTKIALDPHLLRQFLFTSIPDKCVRFVFYTCCCFSLPPIYSSAHTTLPSAHSSTKAASVKVTSDLLVAKIF